MENDISNGVAPECSECKNWKDAYEAWKDAAQKWKSAYDKQYDFINGFLDRELNTGMAGLTRRYIDTLELPHHSGNSLNQHPSENQGLE